jgi:hypothetical protein
MITFYLVCFLAGLMLSVVMLLGGMGHFAGHFGGHVHVPHLHVPHAPHGMPVAQGAGSAAQGGATVPWWNAFSIMIFLCWFGAAGYLLTKYGTFVMGVVLVLAAIAGVVGGAIIFLFLTRVLMPHEHELTADETEIVGAVGHVSSPIRAGGTGEILYQQLGSVVSSPARSEDGVELGRQEEICVIRYEKGIAYVRRFEDVSDPWSAISGQSSLTQTGPEGASRDTISKS